MGFVYLSGGAVCVGAGIQLDTAMNIFKSKKPDPMEKAIEDAFVLFFQSRTGSLGKIGEDERLTIQIDGLVDIREIAKRIARMVKL